MAFNKEINFKGFFPRYWCITTIQDNKPENKTKVILSLYKDKATRTAQPAATIATLEFVIDGIDKTRKDIYPLLKTINPAGMENQQQKYFADATDDIE